MIYEKIIKGRRIEHTEHTEHTEPVEQEEPVSIEEKCKTRNCQNRKDMNCVMNMCSVCCSRLQRKTIQYNQKNPQKARVFFFLFSLMNRKRFIVQFILFKLKLNQKQLFQMNVLMLISKITNFSQEYYYQVLVQMRCVEVICVIQQLIHMVDMKRVGKK